MKNKWLWGGLLVLALVVAVPLYWAQKQRREIIKLFTLVPNTDSCQMVRGSIWTSTNEVACLPRNGSSALKLVDASTGKHGKLAPPPTRRNIPGNSGINVSPDGKWILWPSRKDNIPMWSAMTFDGKRFVERPRLSSDPSDSNGKVAWLPDSTGWAEIISQGYRDSMRVQQFLRVFALDNVKTRDMELQKASRFEDFVVTEKGQAIIACAAPPGVRFVTIPLATLDAETEHTIVPPAPDDNSFHVVSSRVSPRGDRIAWIFRKLGNETQSVWLSGVDGKKFERLTPDLHKIARPPFNLRWKPDGQGLSCWRQDGNRVSLWSLNIPSRLQQKP